MNKFVFEWNKKLGDYARRWRIDFFVFSFRIHYWICSDDKRAYHSHPTNIISIGIWGSYLDCRPEGDVFYKAPFINIIRRETRHYVDIQSSPTITLIFTWGKPQRWSFWLKDTMKRKNRDRYFIEHGHHVCDN
jgi:hypothetical protein